MSNKEVNPIDRSSALTGQASIYYTLAGNPLRARVRRRYVATATSDDEAAVAIFHQPNQTSPMTQAKVDHYRAYTRLEDIVWSGADRCDLSKRELGAVKQIEQADSDIASEVATWQSEAEGTLDGCG